MLEIFLCGLIAFAGGYVMIMRVMARSADVLHGEFIDGRERSVSTLAKLWSKYQPKSFIGLRSLR